jgi:hypothetical protein
MPELALPDLHNPEACVYLAAVMFYPRDPQRHQRFLEAVENTLIERVAQRRGSERIPPSMERVALTALLGPKLSEEINKTEGSLLGPTYPRDQMAGLILVFVLACADAPEEGHPATLSYAREVISEAAGRNKILGMGRSSLIRCWRDFAPAAHLTAARLFLPELWQQRAHGGRLAEFLAYSEALRLRGEGYRPRRSHTSLLDPRETWRVPGRFILPKVRLVLPKPSLAH